MPPEYNRRPMLDGPIVAMTTASRPNCGIASIAAPSGDKTFTLGAPFKGADLVVFSAMNSTKVVVIQTLSSAHTIFGTTADKVTLTTGARAVSLRFVGLSSASWGLSAASNSTIAVFTLGASTR